MCHVNSTFAMEYYQLDFADGDGQKFTSQNDSGLYNLVF